MHRPEHLDIEGDSKSGKEGGMVMGELEDLTGPDYVR